MNESVSTGTGDNEPGPGMGDSERRSWYWSPSIWLNLLTGVLAVSAIVFGWEADRKADENVHAVENATQTAKQANDLAQKANDLAQQNLDRLDAITPDGGILGPPEAHRSSLLSILWL